MNGISYSPRNASSGLRVPLASRLCSIGKGRDAGVMSNDEGQWSGADFRFSAIAAVGNTQIKRPLMHLLLTLDPIDPGTATPVLQVQPPAATYISVCSEISSASSTPMPR